ncbi:GNAT family N-acetyltransferase [Streptomyces sp. B1866]|uniref:GNAT family N-acetyltransferase n=1 Tax=Streptomyces sp. B1866 TaxID=3075431 RepID=UPI00288FBEED|nr:GNAT family N-acetyltransferase [Streptomyces sp. B1866]MDT3397346.1 GNAT family N-acetyltransferase [Streptomyces sp. B1866]
MAEISIEDRPDSKRYEARVAGEPAGFAAYILTDELIVFTHTEVDPAYEGQGVGSAIARAALDDVRTRKLKVLPLCPFIKGWIQRHADYIDLVYQAPQSKVSE